MSRKPEYLRIWPQNSNPRGGWGCWTKGKRRTTLITRYHINPREREKAKKVCRPFVFVIQTNEIWIRYKTMVGGWRSDCFPEAITWPESRFSICYAFTSSRRMSWKRGLKYNYYLCFLPPTSFHRPSPSTNSARVSKLRMGGFSWKFLSWCLWIDKNSDVPSAFKKQSQ